MKVIIQTLANKKYEVDIDATASVLVLKTKLHTELALGEIDELKLINLGKILKNEQTLASANVKERTVIVLMISKIKKAPTSSAGGGTEVSTSSASASSAAAASSSSSSSSSSPASASSASASDPVNSPALAPETPTTTNTNITSPVSVPTESNASVTTTSSAASAVAAASVDVVPASGASGASSMVMGAHLEPLITDLMSLGFARDQVQTALRAAYNNADRAAEYLFNGLPASFQQQQQQPRVPIVAVAPVVGGNNNAPVAGGGPVLQVMRDPVAVAGVGASGVGAGVANPLAGLANPLVGLAAMPQFQAMRALLQAQPQLVPLLLQQIAQSDPNIANLIQNNPNAVAELMGGNGDGGVAGVAGDGGFAAAAAAFAAAAAGGGGAGGGGGRAIQVTEEEKDQLDNLVAMGFTRHRVLEAWLLCDRNSEQAGNYLVEHADQDAGADAGPDAGGGIMEDGNEADD